MPALKKQGFVTWQTIQLLLGPDMHVPVLQNAVKQFDVVDPETGNVFPKVLPASCLPTKPDDAMEAWYDTVAQRLQREAEEDSAETEKSPRVRVSQNDRAPRTSNDYSGDSADEKHAAASYFSDPFYRQSRHSRPPIVRHFSKQSAHPYEDPSRGRLISSVRHMLNPFGKSRRMPGRYEDDSLSSDDDSTPVAPVPPPRYVSHASQASHKRPHPQRRESTLSTSSDSDPDLPPSRRRSPVLRHRSPVLRHRRSHEPATSPREYFPAPYEDRRYSHAEPHAHASSPPQAHVQRKEDGPPPLYGPTKSPLFATHVAQLQAHTYYDRDRDRRPSMPARSSYRPHTAHSVRYAGVPPAPPPPPPPDVDPPYSRERERVHPGAHPLSQSRDWERDRDRDRDRDDYHRFRRRSEEFPRERERDRDGLRDKDRTRSHDRVRDEWDEREERSRDRDREHRGDMRGGRAHRYVSGVQDGVGGRRYPVEQSWR